jgi:hypothetical protein
MSNVDICISHKLSSRAFWASCFMYGMSAYTYYVRTQLGICEVIKYGAHSSVMACTSWYARLQLSVQWLNYVCWLSVEKRTNIGSLSMLMCFSFSWLFVRYHQIVICTYHCVIFVCYWLWVHCYDGWDNNYTWCLDDTFCILLWALILGVDKRFPG